MSSLLSNSSCLRVLLFITIIITISDAFQSRKWISSSNISGNSVSTDVSGSRTTSNVAFIQRSRSKNMLLLSIRGGGDDSDDSDDDELEVSDDEYDESEEEETDDEEEETDDEEEETDEEEEEETDEDEEDEDEDEDESTPTLNTPVKITFSTSLYKPNPLIDQSIELTASPTRTVASLKLSISKQLKSKPPVHCIVLKLDGIILDDDEVVVAELVDEDDDEEEDDDDDDDDDDMPKLKIQVDIIPPVDPKFGTEMKGRLDDMTNEQVLDAYVANVAALHQNSLDLIKAQSMLASDLLEEGNETEDKDEGEGEGEDEDNESEEEDVTTITSQLSSNSLDLQKNAIALKDQIMASLNEKELELLKKSDTPSSPSTDDDNLYDDSLTGGDMLLKESLKRKKKRRGGATMNVKRSLQKNLNINWADTIRNFLLFLFFGYFGGRNATSRTIMLLGAPACFITQARPFKIAMKQLFYAIGEPHGLFLSLLPAPQQAIMSLDYNKSLKDLYGENVGEYNELIVSERGGYDSDDDDEMHTSDDMDSDDEEDFSSDDDDDEDDYDDDYDDEYD